MSEQPKQPAPLADLARALTDLEGWSVVWTSGDGNSIVAICRADVDSPLLADLMIFASGNFESSSETFFLPIVWAGLDLIRAWQAPPRPDAAAFEQLIDDVIEDAKYVQESMYSGEVSRSESIRHLAASKAALLAFAPSADAATEERKDRAIRAERDLWLCGQGAQSGERREPCIDARAELMDALFALDEVVLNGGAHE